MASKVYVCCICHKKLDEKPIRLVKQIYGAGKYNQFYPVEFYDFCKRDFLKFQRWLDKHKKESEEMK